MLVTEIFSSIQGEGPYIGYKQIFVRLAGCNLACEYCDEDTSKSEYYDINPLADEINMIAKSWHHSVSFTGGEPLLQVDRLKLLIPELKLPVYLETNGTLPQCYQEIKNMVDIVSLDHKDGYDNEFFEFLNMAVEESEVFVKKVVLKETSVNDLKKLAEAVSEIDKDITFVIQPVTPHNKIKHGPGEKEIMKFYNIAKKYLNEVRVIPQAHRMMGVK